MLKSNVTILACLKLGGHIAMGAASGYWLIDHNGKKHRVSGRSVQELRRLELIARTDNRTSTIGKTWGTI